MLRPRFIALITLLTFLAWAWLAGWPGRITAVDVNQHRLDTALLPLSPERALHQQFVARRPGLAEIELLVARWEGVEETVGSQVRVELWQADQLVAEEQFASSSLRHNQPLLFRFAPQWPSAGQLYELRLTATAPTAVSFWGYSLDSYAGGGLTAVPEPTTAQDLRFTTRYQLSGLTAVTILATMLRSDGLLLLLMLAFISMPGGLLLSFYGRRWPVQWDAAAWWGTAVALSLAIWPLLWLWFNLLGGRWHGGLLWLLFIAGGLVLLWRLDWSGWRGAAQDRRVHLALLLLLLVSVAVRLLAVRDLAFPPWVDSGRHGLITAVMVDNGRLLTDYEPYLPVDRSPYHFGFHTVATSLVLMTGAEIPRLLLLLGQLLNGLLPLILYTAAWWLTRRPWVGLVAAFLVALPFFFPAYYATWGRMTQLAGMMVMPLLLVWSWLAARPGRWRVLGPLVAILAAGLFLIHFRVFLLYLPFLGLLLILTGGQWLKSVWAGTAATNQGAANSFGGEPLWASLNTLRRTPFGVLLTANGLAALLVLPRAVQLYWLTNPAQQGLGRSPEGYNAFPTGYLTTGWETYFAIAGGVAGLLVVTAVLRGRRWAKFPLLLLAWVGLLFLSLAGGRLGLPELWLINLNSMYITLFAPLALLLALAVYQLQRWLRRRAWYWSASGTALLTLFLAAATLFGLRQQITILNPQTILAQPADQAGIAWLAENLPAEATIAVHSWRWLGNTYSATDGGIWIVPLTGRQTTTPPADYVYNPSLYRQLNAFNEAAAATEDWADPAAARWLREQGVTHIYVGARGGFFNPAVLNRNPEMSLLYQHDGVFVFALTPQ
jgi:hypothetical protein